MTASHRAGGTTGITDTHVHIFRKDGRMAQDRRYAPEYDALPAQLASKMLAAGVARAMLVQPSFLGTDNHYLLETIAAAPEMFGGIAVVAPSINREELKVLRNRGIAGVRLNCIGREVPDFRGEYADLPQHLAQLGMVLQIQAEGAQWPAMEAFLSNPPGVVVIDHFGRTAVGDASGGFESLLRTAGRGEKLWFKFSAPYRLAEGAAELCASALRNAVGAERIVWGSDWPHTQFEGRNSYRDTLGWLDRWIPSAEERTTILVDNPARLFGAR